MPCIPFCGFQVTIVSKMCTALMSYRKHGDIVNTFVLIKTGLLFTYSLKALKCDRVCHSVLNTCQTIKINSPGHSDGDGKLVPGQH